MREIKFRAKRIDMDRWIYGQYFTTPLTDENSGTKPDVGWFFLTGETRHCIVQNMVSFVIDLKTLGQYTGFLDINGKEIYEGDVIKWADWEKVEQITPLEWDVAMCRFVCRYKNGYWRLFGSEFSVEIIGNIY